MRNALHSIARAVLLCIALAPGAQAGDMPRAEERELRADDATLYVRAIGHGEPIVVLHGGPDFDQAYLAPDLDPLADAYRLIYYDQRGRGRSTAGVDPQRVSLATDLGDIDRIRREFDLDAPVLLGHSWGAVLALEYALRHPQHVSRLILVNPAPVSHADLASVRAHYLARLGPRMDEQTAIVESAAYRAGDPDAVAARYRIHFEPAVAKPDDLARMTRRMQDGFERQGREGILTARAVEGRLMADTWERPDYDLLPALERLRTPTLVIAGRRDFMADAAVHIADAMPQARLVMIGDCGHFAFLECAAPARAALDRFMARPRP